ncbi:hypothetical protein FIBSPDRAFT_96960 [Athelia psychrophila]|uniref:Uncharacterized protein n=1 Tax=Athelia psychrophila TaxID=1759441 RepID=A0A167SUA1_9AGAM|nr:hypothetical protein FIBSPDRAFT_96960 [Fibularhizoctonia sp. CBS 109695]
MGSSDNASCSDSTGSNPGVPVPVWQSADLKSCTRTTPSYQPETMIWSEPPQGLEGGTPEMPYTADDRRCAAECHSS